MKTLSLACLTGSCFLGVLLFFYWKNNFINPVYQVYAENAMMSTANPEPDFLSKSHAVISPGDVALPSKKSATATANSAAFFAPVSSRFLVPAPVVSIDYTAVKTKVATKRLAKKMITRRDLMASMNMATAFQATGPSGSVAYSRDYIGEKKAEVALPAVTVTKAPEVAVVQRTIEVTVAPGPDNNTTTTTTTATHRSLAVAEDIKTDKKSFYVPAYIATRQTETGNNNYSYMMLYNRAEKLKEYADEHGYDTEYAFMIDMGMKSGKKRFFVVDLANMTIVKSGLVAHGRGEERFTFDKKYSNKPGSNCTSLGMYKVGKFYNGIFGPAYRLVGLQESNSNAVERAIVLHGMNCIPYEESDFPVCQSEGCPSLSPKFLKEIKPLIDGRTKPMLLWMFDSRADNDAL